MLYSILIVIIHNFVYNIRTDACPFNGGKATFVVIVKQNQYHQIGQNLQAWANCRIENCIWCWSIDEQFQNPNSSISTNQRGKKIDTWHFLGYQNIFGIIFSNVKNISEVHIISCFVVNFFNTDCKRTYQGNHQHSWKLTQKLYNSAKLELAQQRYNNQK